MSKHRSALAIVGLAAALAYGGPVAAQGIGWSSAYFGGSLGQSEAKDGCDGVPDCDEKDTAWRLFGGFQLNRMLGVELGYADLGEVSAPGISAEATAWDLSAIASFPIAERFSLFGRLGAYHAETELRAGALSTDDSNSGVTFGFGAGFDLSRNVGLRAEWQRYADVGDDDAESDVDVLSIGALWRF